MTLSWPIQLFHQIHNHNKHNFRITWFEILNDDRIWILNTFMIWTRPRLAKPCKIPYGAVLREGGGILTARVVLVTFWNCVLTIDRISDLNKSLGIFEPPYINLANLPRIWRQGCASFKEIRYNIFNVDNYIILTNTIRRSYDLKYLIQRMIPTAKPCKIPHSAVRGGILTVSVTFLSMFWSYPTHRALATPLEFSSHFPLIWSTCRGFGSKKGSSGYIINPLSYLELFLYSP